MNIDIITIMIMIMVGNMLTGILALSYMINRQDRRIKVVFLLAKLLQTIGWVLIALRGLVPDVISMVLGNHLIIIALLFEAWAIVALKRDFVGPIRLSLWAITMLEIAMFMIVFFFFNSEGNRLFIFSLGTALIMTGPTYVLLSDRRRSVLQLVFGVSTSLLVVLMLFRAINGLVEIVDYSVFSNHWFNKLSYILLFGYMMITNLGFILLSKERTDTKLMLAATLDQLTMICNRRTFLEASFTCIDKARDKQQPVSLIMFDIDRFKDINDTYGHMVGDEVLQEVAKLVRETTNGCETVGRFGGDEFALLLPGYDEEKSSKRAQTLIDTISSSRFSSKQLPLAVSVGVVTIVPNQTTNFDSYYRLADKGLYEAKKEADTSWKRAALDS